MTVEHTNVIGIAIAALGGAAVGLEREWSGHAGGAEAHFAGIRTFTLLGGMAGVAGWLWTFGYHAVAIVLLAGATALVVAAYIAASRRVIDGTTEVAALVVLSAGVLAGTGYLVLASAIVAITTLLLVEKSWLHAMIARIDDAGLRAGARFAVMAIVILPLLPDGPYGPLGGVRPRQLWLFVLLFSGLSFIGYVARRFVGSERGFPVSGLLGGFVSSTAVALTFARISRQERESSFPLSIGVAAACTIMNLRVLAATAILRPALALTLIPYLVAPFLVGAIIVLVGLKRREAEGSLQPPSNPLQVMSALQMAVLFQVVLFAVHAVRSHWGATGLLVSGAVLGLTDVDVLTISMAKSAEGQIPIPVAAEAIAIGILSNTILKLLLGAAVGRGRFQVLTPAWLAIMAVASAASIAALR
jgi:uncharacterized membrane protein (DUF4010 family)